MNVLGSETKYFLIIHSDTFLLSDYLYTNNWMFSYEHPFETVALTNGQFICSNNLQSWATTSWWCLWDSVWNCLTNGSTTLDFPHSVVHCAAFGSMCLTWSLWTQSTTCSIDSNANVQTRVVLWDCDLSNFRDIVWRAALQIGHRIVRSLRFHCST